MSDVKEKDGKSGLRKVLSLAGIIVVLVAGVFFYLFSGRYAETDNSYIKSDIVSISPQVTGPIIYSPYIENTFVKAGTVMIKIEPAPFEIALAQAEANLVTARADVEKLKAQYLQQQSSIEASAADLLYKQQNFDRISKLRSSKAVSQTDVDQAQRDLKSAQDSLAAMKQQLAGVVAQLNGDPNIKTEDHPEYKAAFAARNKAKLDLDHTIVYAPFDGITSGMPVAGDYARASFPSFSLVKTQHIWIEANFKETQLTQMHVGDPVKIDVDTYPAHEWTGKVESISPASGSEFSILPAQNSSGNWVKVVQRISVRIAINDNKNAPPLRAGMSTEVTVDTGRYPHLPHAKDDSRT